jgi:hypothetical protein
LVLALCTAALAAVPAVAFSAPIKTESVGFANTGSYTTHANHFNKDGLPSSCDDTVEPAWMVPTMTTTPAQTAYRVFSFHSRIQETACITTAVSTLASCTGTNAVMSESYAPSYDPANITTNWLGDLGDTDETAYSFVVGGGGTCDTVIDRDDPSGSCPGVTLTWTSDHPWANFAPQIGGLAAVGRELSSASDIWAGDPAVAHQWLRCDAGGSGCTAIPGATDAKYVPSDADIGHALEVQETATESGVTSTSLASDPTMPVVIPAIVRDDSLGAGDSAMPQKLSISGTPSSCESPKSAPAPMGFNEFHLYDKFTVTSLINEPTCMFVAGTPCSIGVIAVYSPKFVPASIAQNYVADDSAYERLSYTLPAGATTETVRSDWSGFNSCPHYTMLFGTVAPFATASPAVSGAAVEGGALTTSNGEWGGSPSFQQSWLRCDVDGNACEPIAGATGASYTPRAADVDHRLRSRVTATEVNRSSADSAPSPVIGRDVTPPHGTLKLGRTNLEQVLKRRYIPVTVTCDERCAVTVRAARKGKRIAAGRGTAAPGTEKKLKVKLTRRARRTLRRVRIVRFRLDAKFTDARGNASSARKNAKLRRKR